MAFVNGAPQGVLWHDKDNWTMYVSPYMVVNSECFMKHYYAGGQRIASKIGTGSFNNLYDAAKACVTAGQKDYAERLNQITQSRNDYYAALGIPPGPPTAKGIYGEAEYRGEYGDYMTAPLGNYDTPEGWPMKPYKRPYGGTPGPPVMYEKPSNPEDEGAGYGFESSGAKEKEVYLYHPDHLGSTTYITDKDGNVTQFVSYKPLGEALVDEHSTSFDTPWKFNGKELDAETGLYYYGARYYEPTLALWYGVDALAEKYPSMGGYVYCAGNPVKLVDVDGKDWVEGENGIYWDKNVSSATDKNLKEGEKYLGVEGYAINNETGYTIHYDSNGHATETSIGLNEVEAYGNMMLSVVHKGQRDFIIGAIDLTLSPLNMFGNYVGDLIWGEGNHESYLFGSFELSCGPQLGIEGKIAGCGLSLYGDAGSVSVLKLGLDSKQGIECDYVKENGTNIFHRGYGYGVLSVGRNYSKEYKIDSGSGHASKAVETSNVEMNAFSFSFKAIIGIDVSIGMGNRKK